MLWPWAGSDFLETWPLSGSAVAVDRGGTGIERRTLRGRHSHNAQSRLIRWMKRQLGEAAQVLGDGCERELELSARRPPQPQSSHPKDTLQMGEQHLDLLAIAARLLVSSRLGNGAGDVSRRLVLMPRDLPARRLRAASRFEWAVPAIRDSGVIRVHAVIPQSSVRRQNFTVAADVDIAAGVVDEIGAAERAVLAL